VEGKADESESLETQEKENRPLSEWFFPYLVTYATHTTYEA
jgi:hypothetical protein